VLWRWPCKAKTCGTVLTYVVAKEWVVFVCSCISFLGAFTKLFYHVLSVHMEQLDHHWMDIHETVVWIFFKNLWRKFMFHYSLTKITGILCGYQCTFLIISSWILHRMRSVLDKCCREKSKQILSSIPFFWKLCCLWDNVEKYGRAKQATYDDVIWHVRISCWITKATDMRSEYVILLFHSSSGYMNVPQFYVYTYYLSCYWWRFDIVI
jgi:hypothetical protein